MKPVIPFLLAFFLFIQAAQSQTKVAGAPLLRHVVKVTFKAGAPSDIINAVDRSFKSLSKLKWVKQYEWGLGYDKKDTIHIVHVYTTSFASAEDENSYGSSPEHLAHIKLGAADIESVQAVDYWVRK